jgi:hypothetical protein
MIFSSDLTENGQTKVTGSTVVRLEHVLSAACCARLFRAIVRSSVVGVFDLVKDRSSVVRMFDLIEDFLALAGSTLLNEISSSLSLLATSRGLRLAICFCNFCFSRLIAVAYISKTFFLDDLLAKKITSFRNDLFENV